MPLRRCPTGASLVLLPFGFLLDYFRRTGTAEPEKLRPCAVSCVASCRGCSCTSVSLRAPTPSPLVRCAAQRSAAAEPAPEALQGLLALAASLEHCASSRCSAGRWNLGLAAVALPARPLAPGVVHAAAENGPYHFYDFILPIRGSCGALLFAHCAARAFMDGGALLLAHRAPPCPGAPCTWHPLPCTL